MRFPTNSQWDAMIQPEPPGCPPYCEYAEECKGDGECALRECGMEGKGEREES